MSRSAFAARFNELVGEPAMAYVARWRMYLAVDALKERHALGSLPEFLARGAANAVTEKVRLTYYGLFGSAINVGGYYRWEKARPKKSLLLEWARPLWIPFYFRTIADRETQPFDVNGATTMKAEGVEVGARKVIGPRTVMQLGFKTRDRSFSEVRPDTPPGVVRGLSLGFEHNFWDSYRRRLDWSLSGFKAGKPLGSDVDYPKAVTSIRYEDILSTPDGTDMEKSVIVARALPDVWTRATPERGRGSRRGTSRGTRTRGTRLRRRASPACRGTRAAPGCSA